ncbi:MAG: ADP-heptose:LPS heptosyltransferase [Crocinitomix sp.]|jgi:ADP-heptose:LPS heptosyltransferase
MNQYDIAIAATKEMKKDFYFFCSKSHHSFEYDNAKESLFSSLTEIEVYINKVENNHSRELLKEIMVKLKTDLEYVRGEKQVRLIDQLIETFSSVSILEYLHPNL